MHGRTHKHTHAHTHTQTHTHAFTQTQHTHACTQTHSHSALHLGCSTPLRSSSHYSTCLHTGACTGVQQLGLSFTVVRTCKGFPFTAHPTQVPDTTRRPTHSAILNTCWLHYSTWLRKLVTGSSNRVNTPMHVTPGHVQAT